MTTETSMTTKTSETETVVRHHLEAFLQQEGVAAIVKYYNESARLYSESQIYHGKQEISGFFDGFLQSLPAGAIERFELRSMQVEGNTAFITWKVGGDIPLGTDTFVVAHGQIVSQTFAMYTVPVH